MFTIDDMLQIGFFQIIYLILFIYLTIKEISRKPGTSLLWLMIAADVIYIGMLATLIYTLKLYGTKSATASFRWNTLLLSLLVPGSLILLAYTIYHVRRDIKHNKEIKQL